MTDYFRGDQRSGVTAPDLSKDVSYAEHIVKARGKRTQLTSVSKSLDKIRDLGDQIYRFKQQEAAEDEHKLVVHEVLLDALRAEARGESREAKLKAVQALRYARKRLEGLVCWSFDITGVERKDLITWAFARVQPYFEKQ